MFWGEIPLAAPMMGKGRELPLAAPLTGMGRVMRVVVVDLRRVGWVSLEAWEKVWEWFWDVWAWGCGVNWKGRTSRGPGQLKG